MDLRSNADAAVAAMDILRPILELVTKQDPDRKDKFLTAINNLSAEDCQKIAVLGNICSGIDSLGILKQIRAAREAHERGMTRP